MPAAQHHARFHFTLVTLLVSYNWPPNAAAFSVARLRTALLQSALWRSKDTLGRLSRFRSTPYRGQPTWGTLTHKPCRPRGHSEGRVSIPHESVTTWKLADVRESIQTIAVTTNWSQTTYHAFDPGPNYQAEATVTTANGPRGASRL